MSRQPREFDFYIIVEQSIEIFQGSYFLGNGFHPQVSQTLFLHLQSFHIIDLNFRYFFAKKFQRVLEAASSKKAAGLFSHPAENHTKSWLKRLMAFITGHPVVVVDVGAAVDKEGRTKRKLTPLTPLTPDMIRRMDEPPKPINPSGGSSGWVSDRHPRTIPPHSGQSFTSTPDFLEEFPSNGQACRPTSSDKNSRRLSDPGPIPCMLYSIK